MKSHFSTPFIPPKRISRRRLLLGGSAAISLPLLDAMAANPFERHALAESEPKPVRLCYLYFPNGSEPKAWNPDQVDDKHKIVRLSRWMKPLERHKEYLTVLRKVWTPRGNGHGAGTATWLTGGGYDNRKIKAGVSADQIAAGHFASKTLFSSLELSMAGKGFFSNSLPRNTISWDKRGNPVPRETEPRSIFDRMFHNGRDTAIDRSTIDQVLDEIKSLQRKVGTEDTRKLDEYVESIRGVERQIEAAQQNTEKAARDPQLQKFLNRPAAGIPQDHKQYMRLMYDMLVLAFWSDATRVSSFMLDHGQSNRYFNFVDGVKGTWHAISHWRDTSGKTEDDDGIHSWSSKDEKLEMYNRIISWHHEQLAHFLDRLGSVREKDGTLLDQCGILYGSSLSDGHEHGARNLPLLIAGKAGGQIESGRRLSFRRDTSLSGIHLSLLKAAGVPTARFGEAQNPVDLKS